MARHDVHSYADLTQGRIKHLSFFWDVDIEQEKIYAKAQYLIEDRNTAHIDLDMRGLTIKSVTANDEPIGYEIVEQDPILHDCLRVYVPEGTHLFTIEYTIPPDASALMWLSKEQTADGTDKFVFNQSEHTHSRSLFPIQDTPEVRMTYEAEITIPKHLSVVMSASLPELVAEGADRKTNTFRFHMPHAIPCYLIAFVIGSFTYKNISERMRVYAEHTLVEAAAEEFMNADRSLEIAEELFGPYQWGRADFFILPRGFPYGGMENPRLVFLSSTCVTGDGSELNVLDHEFGHFWFGNNVTNATWEDFWINEGFTVFAERKISLAIHGEEFTQMQELLDYEYTIENLNDFGWDNQITALHPDLSGIDTDDYYSTIPYYKGYYLLKLMEEEVGEERFNRFLQEYMQDFHFQSIDTATLLDYIELKLPGVGEKVRIKEWVYEPGLPDNVPDLSSPVVDETRALARRIGESIPTKEETKDWITLRWMVYLDAIPHDTSKERIKDLDERYNFSNHANKDVRTKIFTAAVRAGYLELLPDIDRFFSKQGRGKYLLPVYRALFLNPDTREICHELYNKHKEGYHASVNMRIEGMFARRA